MIKTFGDVELDLSGKTKEARTLEGSAHGGVAASRYVRLGSVEEAELNVR